MSSYLTFYLVPKKSKTKYTKDEEIEIEIPQEPLAVFSYCRSDAVYEQYYSSLHPAYAGSEDKYTEITEDDAKSIVRSFEREDLNPAKERLEILYKLFQIKYDNELANDIISLEDYIKGLEYTLSELKYIARFIEEITYSDFEKVLINID